MKNDANRAIHDTMYKLFDQCATLSNEIGARYVEVSALRGDGSEAALDRSAELIAEIGALGVKLAAAFGGMMMTAELSKAIGLTAKDIIEAASTEHSPSN